MSALFQNVDTENQGSFGALVFTCRSNAFKDYFIKIINEYNNLFVQNQINYIKNILKFNVRNINTRIKEQIKCSYDWCLKYEIPINQESIYLK